ncbi:MAG: hypothetical protein ACE5GV_03975 [Candidatus Scalindua sp.]
MLVDDIMEIKEKFRPMFRDDIDETELNGIKQIVQHNHKVVR